MRRLLAVALTIAGVVLVAWAVTRLVGRPSAPQGGTRIRPSKGANLLLVTLDTTRADYLGVYGGEEGLTPNLDRLAERGVTFLETQSTAPITLVAHASILTGRYPFNHEIRNNGMYVLPDDVPTLATVLGERGYRTGAFVSAYVLARRYGLDRGFEVYDDDLSRGRHEAANVVPSRRAEVTLEPAIEWLDSLEGDEPFFCWIHFYDPHAPYDPPEEFRRRYPTDPYSGEIASMDSVIGRLLDVLSERGLEENTFLAVVGDHGEALGEHGEQTHAVLLHQATLRVPFLLAGPRLPRATRVRVPVSIIDLVPTACRLLGVPQPAAVDGTSVTDLLAGDTATFLDRSLYAETMLPRFQYGWSQLRSLRRNRWHLVKGTREELFDLRDDPRELIDRRDLEATTGDGLAADLETIVGRDRDLGSAARTTISQDEMERLQALGYLGSEVAPRGDPPDPRDLITAHVHTERSRALAAQGLAEEALAELDTMLELDPQNTSALSLQARLLGQLRRFEEARAVLERLLALDPQSAPAYRQLAQLELIDRNPDRALELARLGAGKRGAFEALAVTEAAALVALGRVADAVALLDARLREHPDDPELLAARAGLHLAGGDTDSAETLLRHAVEVDALHTRSRLALADLLSAHDHIEEAVGLLRDLLRIDPGEAEALARIGTLWLDRPDAARPYLEEAVRLQPYRADHLLRLGVCYVRLGDHRRAEAALRRALDKAPDNPDVLSNLAVALTVQGRHSEAEEALRTALELRPGMAEAHNNLALCLMYQEKYAEAEREVLRALDDNPGMRDARLTLSTLMERTGRVDEAATVLESLRADSPSDPEIAARLGVALEAAGRTDEALSLVRAAMVSFPENLEVIRAAARAEEAAGDPAAAQRLYAKLAQRAPRGALRDEAVAALERMALAGDARSSP
jgi:arylsulfatase A-like enzyme/tetratricopeptide (TPR) repeat protein